MLLYAEVCLRWEGAWYGICLNGRLSYDHDAIGSFSTGPQQLPTATELLIRFHQTLET